jgi:hypothetical protein
MTTNDKSEQLTAPRAYPFNRQSGKIGWAILWLLGIPLPVLLVLYLVLHH